MGRLPRAGPDPGAGARVLWKSRFLRYSRRLMAPSFVQKPIVILLAASRARITNDQARQTPPARSVGERPGLHADDRCLRSQARAEGTSQGLRAPVEGQHELR